MLQMANFIKILRAYKKEQMESISREREQLEEERRKSADMMNELLALKAQLDAQQGAAPPPSGVGAGSGEKKEETSEEPVNAVD